MGGHVSAALRRLEGQLEDKLGAMGSDKIIYSSV